jgi:5-dehydro-4-deoxyglucarate dehydratase
MKTSVGPLYAMRARRKGYEVSTMKALMDLAGLHGGPVRSPLVDVAGAEKEELRSILETWKPFLD